MYIVFSSQDSWFRLQMLLSPPQLGSVALNGVMLLPMIHHLGTALNWSMILPYRTRSRYTPHAFLDVCAMNGLKFEHIFQVISKKAAQKHHDKMHSKAVLREVQIAREHSEARVSPYECFIRNVYYSLFLLSWRSTVRIVSKTSRALRNFYSENWWSRLADTLQPMGW